MYLNTVPYSADHLRIHIPSWNRAPLGLGDGTNGHLVRTGDPTKYRADRVELIISPFDYTLWGDLWTLELQFIDKPGQFSALVNLFDRMQITILASESHQAYREKFFSISLVLDCSKYTSEIDGNSDMRQAKPSSEMLGLYTVLVAEFITDVRLVGLNHPRLAIRRNWPHYDLYSDFVAPPTAGKQELARNTSDIVPIKFSDNGWFSIPPPKDSFLIYGNNKWRALTSTNTRSRLLHLTLVAKNDNYTVSLVFYFDKNDEILTNILNLLSSENYNILRHQLRPFLLEQKPPTVAKNRFGSPYTLNVLLEARDGRPLEGKDHSQIIQQKLDAICGLNRVCVRNVDVHRPFVTKRTDRGVSRS